MARPAYAQRLVDQCVVWCRAKREEPVRPVDRWFVEQAVSDYKGTFKELSPSQRRGIAGLGVFR